MVKFRANRKIPSCGLRISIETISSDKEFNAFMVEDRPGEQLVTLSRSMYNETIKIEATMFDGYGVVAPNSRDEDTDDEQLHISVLVDITKGEGGDTLEFICSAWQERLEIQKLYVFGLNGRSLQPYIGPDFSDKEFNAFMVEDRPGEQLVTLSRSMYNETIKIEATMFDGYGVVAPNSRDEDTDDEQLHISVLVDITKGEGGDTLEFICSAWQERLEIQKLYVFGLNGRSLQPYIGPDFRVVDKKLQSSLYDFLNARGINDDLSVFLHRYVWNKDKLEHMQCLKRLKSYVER
ncbi:Mitochondrial glycoprotein [Artemisia annua]|uniref:Mitochondrial glycoprotein n=1 Tax=Artemisia annua TaxID=35608 RepID=A0A2U1NTC1_ARTAN|nr:Mitochondrial glycoprotein [Artemisia annua]